MADKRYLYEVYVIDPKHDKVLAKVEGLFGVDKQEALVGADIKAIAEKANVKIKDLSIGVIELCEVKQPVKKVRIVDDD